jgi:hypothetical protein
MEYVEGAPLRAIGSLLLREQWRIDDCEAVHVGAVFGM